jgi:hypothetical protein
MGRGKQRAEETDRWIQIFSKEKMNSGGPLRSNVCGDNGLNGSTL